MNKFENLENKGTYSHTEHCSNCGSPNMVQIPKGQTIGHYLMGYPCSNCGVSLRKSKYDEYKPDVWMKAEL